MQIFGGKRGVLQALCKKRKLCWVQYCNGAHLKLRVHYLNLILIRLSCYYEWICIPRNLKQFMITFVDWIFSQGHSRRKKIRSPSAVSWKLGREATISNDMRILLCLTFFPHYCMTLYYPPPLPIINVDPKKSGHMGQHTFSIGSGVPGWVSSQQ